MPCCGRDIGSKEIAGSAALLVTLAVQIALLSIGATSSGNLRLYKQVETPGSRWTLSTSTGVAEGCPVSAHAASAARSNRRISEAHDQDDEEEGGEASPDSMTSSAAPSKLNGTYDSPPLRGQGQRRPAWIHIMRPFPWTWWPAAATIAEALEGIGMEVHIRMRGAVCDILDGVNSSVQRGIRPIVVGIAAHYAQPQGVPVKQAADCNRKFPEQPWEIFHDLGAYLILYQTEPRSKWWRSLLRKGKDWNVTEIWTYSRSIMLQYRHKYAFIHRYFPPGCAKAMDFGVRPQATNVRNITRIGFMGNWQKRSGKQRKAYARIFRGLSVGGPAALQRTLEGYPIQLNAHNKFNSGRNAVLEPMRFTQLLNNRACILSEHGHRLDEKEWNGLVRFEEMTNIAEVFDELRCNPAALEECLRRTHKDFCTRFRPSVLLANSGFNLANVSL